VQTKFPPIIPLVIIAFRKKDGGISACSKKNVLKSKRFFDNRCKNDIYGVTSGGEE
jgi:hypothetical protein